jgi:hypothetical protein
LLLEVHITWNHWDEWFLWMYITDRNHLFIRQSREGDQLLYEMHITLSNWASSIITDRSWFLPMHATSDHHACGMWKPVAIGISGSKALIWIHQFCFIWKDCQFWDQMLDIHVISLKFACVIRKSTFARIDAVDRGGGW